MSRYLFKLSEDYISTQHPFRGRSASQVLHDYTSNTFAKVWAVRNIMKCRLGCANCCQDIAVGIQQFSRSSRVSDKSSTNDKFIIEKLRSSNTFKIHKWQLWRRFFHRNKDVMSKKETRMNAKTIPVGRRNAGLFVADYEEEQTASTSRKDSLELCDMEDSGHYDMNSKD